MADKKKLGFNFSDTFIKVCIIVSSVIDTKEELAITPCGNDLLIWENEFVCYKLFRHQENETIFLDSKSVEMTEIPLYLVPLNQSEKNIVTLLKILENEL